MTEWISPGKHDRILDAACGRGTLARAMARKGELVTGIDLCPQMIRLARRAKTPNTSTAHATFAIGNVECLPYRSGHFSLTACANSFANFPDPLRVLRELARVTKRGGRIVVADVVAPEESAQCASLNRLESLRGHTYTRVLKQSEFLDLFRKAGLRVVSRQLQQRSQRLCEWLRLSPSASRPPRAQRLRHLVLASARSPVGRDAGVGPRRAGREIVVGYTTARFMLRRC